MPGTESTINQRFPGAPNFGLKVTMDVSSARRPRPSVAMRAPEGRPVCRKKMTARLKPVTKIPLKLFFLLQEARRAIRQAVVKTRQGAYQSGLGASGAIIASLRTKGANWANPSRDARFRGCRHDNQSIRSLLGALPSRVTFSRRRGGRTMGSGAALRAGQRCSPGPLHRGPDSAVQLGGRTVRAGRLIQGIRPASAPLPALT